jgi:hypothetical protein
VCWCGVAVGGGADLLTPVPLTARLEGTRAVCGRHRGPGLLPAPDANPGMLEMMRLRDRAPDYEDPVPWAGEFTQVPHVGGAHAAGGGQRALDEMTHGLIAELIATQTRTAISAPSGGTSGCSPLGPVGALPRDLACTLVRRDGRPGGARRRLQAADLVCATYLDSGRRVLDAGSAEMKWRSSQPRLLHRQPASGVPAHDAGIEEDVARPRRGTT